MQQLSNITGLKPIQFGKDDELNKTDQIFTFGKVDWVFWGTENLFPNKFLLRLNESAFFNRISTTQVNMVCGEGFTITGRQAEQAQNYLDLIGVDDELLKRLAWDVVVLNALSLQVVLNQSLEFPAKVFHTKSEKVRVDKHLDRYDNPLNYWVAKDWSKITINGRVDNTIPQKNRKDYEPIKLPKYEVGTQIPLSLIYNIEYNPAMEYYPVPPAESAFNEIDLNVKIMEYQNANIDNGISGSVVITYPKQIAGTIEEENKEQEAITRGIRESLAGAKNAGTALVVFYDPQGETKPEIGNFPTDQNDKKFIETNRMVRESIFTGLGVVSEELFGIPSSTGFSSQSDMLLTANELTYHNIIRPKQRMILSTINQFLEHAKIDATVEILNGLPVSTRLTLDMVEKGIITVNEYRESLGFSSIEATDIDIDEQNVV